MAAPDSFNMMVTLAMMIGLLIILPLGLFFFGYVNKNYKRVGVYLGGGNIDDNTYEGAMASTQPIAMRNYYLEKYFGEDRLFNVGVLVSMVLFCVMFGVAFI